MVVAAAVKRPARPKAASVPIVVLSKDRAAATVCKGADLAAVRARAVIAIIEIATGIAAAAVKTKAAIVTIATTGTTTAAAATIAVKAAVAVTKTATSKVSQTITAAIAAAIAIMPVITKV